MRILKKLVICLWVICLVLPITPGTPAFAKGIKLSKKSITLYVGQTKTVRLKGTAKKPKWSSSKKSVATVTNNGKIKAKRKGNAVITAKLEKKKYKCKVKVKEKAIVPPTPTDESDDSTVAGNYRKLSNHLKNYGEYDAEDGDYYIDDSLILSDEELYIQISYQADGSFNFAILLNANTSYGRANNTIILTITPPEYTQATVAVSYISNLVGFLYAKGIVTLSTLTKTNTAITYTSTNAATTSEKNALYELGKTGLRVGLSYWNTLLEESGADLTLSDLGFTSYDSIS